jgi:hypothetical protein
MLIRCGKGCGVYLEKEGFKKSSKFIQNSSRAFLTSFSVFFPAKILLFVCQNKKNSSYPPN